MTPTYQIRMDNEQPNERSYSYCDTTDKEVVDIAIAAYMTDTSITRMRIDKVTNTYYTTIFLAERSRSHDRTNSSNQK